MTNSEEQCDEWVLPCNACPSVMVCHDAFDGGCTAFTRDNKPRMSKRDFKFVTGLN